MAAGARVTVIAPGLTGGLAAQHRAGRFAHVARAYRHGDLAGAFLVIGATDDPEVNHAVHAEAVSVGALINVVDDVPYCQFILPSILRRGDFTVAVSSAGHAPALAVRVRERLERELGDEYGRFLELAAELRAPLATAVPDFQRRKAIWYRLVDSDVLVLLRAGQEARARARVAEITGVELGGASGRGSSTEVAGRIMARRPGHRLSRRRGPGRPPADHRARARAAAPGGRCGVRPAGERRPPRGGAGRRAS